MSVHCWEDGPKRLLLNADGYPDRELGSTCMLDDGHDGPHDFTPDEEIGIRFAPSEKSEIRQPPAGDDK